MEFIYSDIFKIELGFDLEKYGSFESTKSVNEWDFTKINDGFR